jgi:hypothetical protein
MWLTNSKKEAITLSDAFFLFACHFSCPSCLSVKKRYPSPSCWYSHNIRKIIVVTPRSQKQQKSIASKMTLDAATKEKYCSLYKESTKSWTSGAVDFNNLPDIVTSTLADNVVQCNADLPRLEGKEAVIASFANWTSTLSLIHDIQAIWCTDDGWVNVIITMAYTGYNADKSKIVASVQPAFTRVHFDAQGKIDESHSYWDTSKLMPQLMSTAADSA